MHWISVTLPDSITHGDSTARLDELIRASYDLVVSTLPRASRPADRPVVE